MSPAIREIRRIYPKAYITLLASHPYVALAETCPYVDEIIFRNWQGPADGGVFWEKNMLILPSLLDKHFDVAITFKNFADFHWLMYASGARVRVTFAPFEELGKLCTKIIPDKKLDHAVDYFLSVVESQLYLPLRIENWKFGTRLQIFLWLNK